MSSGDRLVIVQFPLAHHDELLGSVISRYITRQGIKDDKVALDLLYGNRKIVPSPLFPGHISQLLDHIDHLWQKTPKQIVDQHTLLPLFRPFISPKRYQKIFCNLSNGSTNSFALRSGLNASIQIWPSTYKVCPKCWHSQLKIYGYTYWNRILQCPGVVCCPIHGCLLVDTKLPMYSLKRHHFVGTHETEIPIAKMTATAELKFIRFAAIVRELIEISGPTPTLNQWSCHYKVLASDSGLISSRGVNHKEISDNVSRFWGDKWLTMHGLGIDFDYADNWLVRIFRKHRRPFTYLQHIAVCLALTPELNSINDILCKAIKYPEKAKKLRPSPPLNPSGHRITYRKKWLEALNELSTLKKIRANKEGNRLYFWLYRNDYIWLQANKPSKFRNNAKPRINWHRRDLQIVRKLFEIEKEYWLHLYGPRRSKKWYSRKIGNPSLFEKKLHLLPLCRAFFIRYAETVEEYQARRLVAVMVDFARKGKKGVAIHEVRRITGLSEKRCRKLAKLLFQKHFSTWSNMQAIPQGCAP